MWSQETKDVPDQIHFQYSRLGFFQRLFTHQEKITLLHLHEKCMICFFGFSGIIRPMPAKEGLS